MSVKAGDAVRIVSRDVTPEDAKSGLYYSYFGGLTGKVDRVYPDGSVCVDVDLDSLTEETRGRHVAVQEAERKRWLEGLSDEVRNRLSADQKQLKMSYRILLSAKDLEVTKGGKPSPERAPVEEKAAAAQGTGGGKGAQRAPESRPEPKTPGEPEAPHRLSEADLQAAEEAFLRSRKPGS